MREYKLSFGSGAERVSGGQQQGRRSVYIPHQCLNAPVPMKYTFRLLDASQFGYSDKQFALSEKRRKKKRVARRRNLFVFLLFLVLVNFFGLLNSANVFAASGSELLDELSTGTLSQLDVIDMSNFEDALGQLSGTQAELFNGKSFLEKVQSLLSGEFSEGADTFFQAFLKLFFEEFLSGLPLIAIVAVVAILCGVISQIRPSFLSNSTGEIVFFACFAVVIVTVLAAVTSLVNLTGSTVMSMKTQMNAAFPILLTLIAGMGGTVTVKVYQPAVALLSVGIVEIVTSVLLPIFIFTLVFSVVGNLSKNIKLTQLTSFFKSVSKTILTAAFTIFTAFVSVQGITAGTFDGVSIRAAKFATRTYVPILGGYLADGFDLILASGVLIKNSVGVAGLLLLFVTILSPIIKILVMSLGLRLTAAIIEPITDKRITDFVADAGKNLSMLTVIILAVAFMYFLCVMLLILSSNAFW